MSTEAERKATEQAIQALADLGQGHLTPEKVVEAARDPESPLHRHFSWDDAEAATQWRLEQARALIRSVKVTFKVEQREVRAPYFLRDPAKPKGQQGYTSLPRLRTDEDAAREVVVREFAAASAALERARAVASVLGMEDEIAGLQDRLGGLRSRLSEVAPEDRRGAA